MLRFPQMRTLAASLALAHGLLVMQVPMANAAMIGTPEVLTEQRQQVDRQQLLAMLDDAEAKAQLEAYGVDRADVERRIASLTPAELAQFNQQLSEAPAGGSVAGVIVLFLVIFIITDMLCATNIFSFIHCINR